MVPTMTIQDFFQHPNQTVTPIVSTPPLVVSTTATNVIQGSSDTLIAYDDPQTNVHPHSMDDDRLNLSSLTVD